MQSLKTYKAAPLRVIAVTTLLAVACKPDIPTDITTVPGAICEARNSGPTYTATNLGALPG